MLLRFILLPLIISLLKSNLPLLSPLQLVGGYSINILHHKIVNRELIIDSNTSEVNIALLEDKSLVELHKEKNNNNFAVGDIFLGKVKKIMPGLNAAFVDVGYEKDAFFTLS